MRSAIPSITPITTDTASTIKVNLRVSFMVGHVTRLSSPTTSPKNLKLIPRLAAPEPNLCCNALPYFPMKGVCPTSRTIFFELKPLRIISAAFIGIVGTLSTIHAAKRD